MHPFRVFISYSHEDRKLAVQVNDVLRAMGLVPVWDKDIRPGTPFSDAIKGLIANAHLFMPLISENSQHRPWVHQETGYAMALNIPVLPVAFGNLPGEMISQLQAISVRLKSPVELDEGDLAEQLKVINIESLVLSPTGESVAIVEVADYTEERTEMMARYANRVAELGSYGHLRQRGRPVQDEKGWSSADEGAINHSLGIPRIDDRRQSSCGNQGPNTRDRYRRMGAQRQPDYCG